MFFTCEPTSSQKWFWKRTRFVPPRLTTSMHRQRASMGCRHSAPVDPIDAPTDAIRPKLLPPSRHGSVIPTARDPLASIGQQSKLPRRSSLSSVGRLGRAAGAPQSRTEFDAALTAKLERLDLSRGTEGSGEADASEAVVEMTTPDRGYKSQQNAHPRRGVVDAATDRDAVADWARRADARHRACGSWTRLLATHAVRSRSVCL